MMNNSQIETYRLQLLQLSSDVQGNVSDVTEQARQPTGGQADGGLSNVPMHLGDLGSEAFTQELNSTLLESEQELSDEIDAALQRIDNGTFGTCEECGQPIAEARLEALPYVRYCIQCADTAYSAPRANLNVGRPRNPRETLANHANQSGEPRDQVKAARSGDGRELADSAAGTAGGGTAAGGLAGTNHGAGDPEDVDLEQATASGRFNPESEDPDAPYSGSSAGTIGGAPANGRGAVKTRSVS
jgi:DnaK suppressor protein